MSFRGKNPAFFPKKLLSGNSCNRLNRNTQVHFALFHLPLGRGKLLSLGAEPCRNAGLLHFGESVDSARKVPDSQRSSSHGNKHTILVTKSIREIR